MCSYVTLRSEFDGGIRFTVRDSLWSLIGNILKMRWKLVASWYISMVLIIAMVLSWLDGVYMVLGGLWWSGFCVAVMTGGVVVPRMLEKNGKICKVFSFGYQWVPSMPWWEMWMRQVICLFRNGFTLVFWWWLIGFSTDTWCVMYVHCLHLSRLEG